MALKLYNTLTRKKEIFKPIKKDSVSFYYCGPTVYWTQHIGVMFGSVCADLINRTLQYLNYKVKSVRNYTDVGHLTSDQDEGQDKIEKAAQREKLDPQKIADKYIKIFEQDVKDLNILEPSIKPKATEYIQEMIEMTQTLLNKKYAYQTDLAIYFDISKAKNYTQLSGQKIEDKIEGAGKGDVTDPQKKHPADFALWFFKAGIHKNALQTWPSPWGQGFPGWHIECSTMSKKNLGNTIDIHMGGIEHIPVHHTNEIAQSESANEVKFVNYWIHNGHLLVDNKKMSKSLGNVYSLTDVKNKGFNPLALRFLFLQTHYRSSQNFTWEIIKSAQKGLDNLYDQINKLGNKLGKIDKKYKDEFIDKISNDFNIPQALALTQQLLKSDLSNENKLATILDFDKILGLNLGEIKKDKILIPDEIKDLVEQREKARKDEKWKEADKIRKEIEKKGYQIEDTTKHSKVRPR